jgi:predicted dehydrogenase
LEDGKTKTYRVGVIGFAHMHVNETVRCFAEHERCEIVACADTVPLVPSRIDVEGSRTANLRRALDTSPAAQRYDDYNKMLADAALDIVLFCPENARHAEVGEAIARRGAHMVTEKPMAATLADALAMVRAAEQAYIKLAVNWPITWRPPIRAVKRLVAAGEIGKVWQIKWRNGASLGPLAVGSFHPGDTVIGAVSDRDKGAEWWHQSAAGGGALLDYCCYGACLSAWYFDAPPTAAFALKGNFFSRFGDAEDNAAMIVRFPDAMAIVEGTWTTFHAGVPTGPILYGTTGTIVVDGPKVLVFKTRGDPAPSMVLDGDPLPSGRDTIAREFLHHLETGEPLHPTLDLPLNLAAVAVLDAGIRSAKTGALELVDNANWNTGP